MPNERVCLWSRQECASTVMDFEISSFCSDKIESYPQFLSIALKRKMDLSGKHFSSSKGVFILLLRVKITTAKMYHHFLSLKKSLQMSVSVFVGWKYDIKNGWLKKLNKYNEIVVIWNHVLSYPPTMNNSTIG